MEKRVCHSEAMEHLEDAVNEDMLSGDKFLKAVLIRERVTQQSQTENPVKRSSSFKENKEMLERFFMTNVEEMLRSKKILYDAEEKYK
jgi:hypothetical protein